MTLILTIKNEAHLHSVAQCVASLLQPGDVVFLSGGLGVGKTSFTRGCLTALGHVGRVKSPTYSVVESYSVQDLLLHHFDLYRIGSLDELYSMGMEDYFDGSAMCMVEWPEQGQGVLPAADLTIQLSLHGQDGRCLNAVASSARGDQILNELKNNKELFLCNAASDT